ncbi:endoglucanase-like [Pomacea canaliculata]|uniref:Endo-beta-1,4-glucanase n=1 Tax=Pomacea maculata TaxID=1245466 RepID=A7KME9_POMMA|nr:endoglucanase-like [Pomacea canaliculata]ABR92637.1 endo-beta-1,4-glucanase [Ampullaria crossean]
MKLFYLLCLAVPLLEAAQLCQPDSRGVRRFNGKPCASTTRYVDGHKGACGCGQKGSDTPFPWNIQKHVTAPSERYFDGGGSSLWCGRNCGKCVKLTPTGGFVPGKGNAPPNHNPVVFQVTNACPINGNEEWCGISGAPGTGHVNSHGYEVHFDLQDQVGQVEALHWDNPEVTWEETSCPGDLQSNYQQCECHNSG